MALGKSTIAQKLAETFDKGVHLRGDIFRRMIVRGGIDMTPQHSEEALQQLRLRFKMAAKAAEMYYNAGFSVVLQDNYLGEEANYGFL
ncbi:hypothetical protein [Clostridium polynesiense]|uniref:hypothetical protein n=1 Tax=Clostridium polynesiense TaxID=1325933 RepID=UPI0006947DF1|nr:hypothetical protein [Clostridium polynesiense]